MNKQRRTWMLFVVVVAYMISFFQRFAPAGIAQDLAMDFQASATALGVLAAAYFYIYTLMQLPTGILVDWFGARKILCVGLVIASLGSLLFGLAPSLNWAFLGRVLIGLGVSVIFISMLKIIALWYKESRFASVLGLALLLGNLGAVLAGTPLSISVNLFGWRYVFVGVAIFTAILAVLCWLLVEDKQLPADSSQKNTTASKKDSVWVALCSVVKNTKIWPPTIALTGICGSSFAFGGLWASPYLAQVHGMSRTVASNHISLYFAGFALGCLLIGYLSDHLKKRKSIMLISAHLYALFWVPLIFNMPLSPYTSYVYFTCMGFFSASLSLTWAYAKEVSAPEYSGIATSFVNMGGFLCAAILQSLVGFIMDYHWSGEIQDGVRVYQATHFQFGLLGIAITAWIGALSTWWLRETNCRNVWKPK